MHSHYRVGLLTGSWPGQQPWVGQPGLNSALISGSGWQRNPRMDPAERTQTPEGPPGRFTHPRLQFDGLELAAGNQFLKRRTHAHIPRAPADGSQLVGCYGRWTLDWPYTHARLPHVGLGPLSPCPFQYHGFNLMKNQFQPAAVYHTRTYTPYPAPATPHYRKVTDKIQACPEKKVWQPGTHTHTF